MPTARGTFDVTIEAEPPFFEQDGIKLNRNVVRKEFSGDMAGTSEAQMVAAYTATPGSAGYVAIEHFTGSVGGTSGSFVLQHHGLMEKGEAALTVTIVPDSGTGVVQELRRRRYEGSYETVNRFVRPLRETQLRAAVTRTRFETPQGPHRNPESIVFWANLAKNG